MLLINSMKYFSTFSGIGGFELGIQQAYENNRQKEIGKHASSDGDSKNIESIIRERKYPICIGYSEIDKYAIQVYNKQFNHKNYGDITNIQPSDLPNFDLFVGGFPCQSFSIAGKRGGFNDTRGTMFFEIARIVREKQPRLLLLENVKGLLSHDKGQTFYTIISTLDELGYDCQWQVLNSKNFGVPQNRERVFIIGHLRGTRRPEVFPLTETARQDNSVEKIENLSNSNQRNVLYNKKGLSPTLNTAQGGGLTPLVNDRCFVNEPRFGEHEKSNIAQTVKVGGTIGNVCAAQRGRYNSDGKTEQKLEKRQDNVTNTLTSVQKDNLILQKSQSIRRLTPKECERLQGFPDDWTAEGVIREKRIIEDLTIRKNQIVQISDTQRYKMCGNAVTVNVIRAIIEKLI